MSAESKEFKVKIRPYNVGDLFFAVKMISAITGSAGDELKNLFSGVGSGAGKELTEAQEKEQGVAIVIMLLNKCFVAVEDMLQTFMASLCGMSKEDFLNLPPEAVLDIIEQIAEAKESKDFFLRACQLFRKIGGSPTTTSEESEK